MDKIDEFYIIIEVDNDGTEYFCDKDLNRDEVFDRKRYIGSQCPPRAFCCSLITKDEIEAIKENTDNVLEYEDWNDDEELICGYYHIFRIPKDLWTEDIKEVYNWKGFEEFDDYKDYKEDEEDVFFGEEYDEYCEEFENDMVKKYGCLDVETYFFEFLAMKAFEETRFYPGFIYTVLEMYVKDFKEWWRENIKSKKLNR